MRILAVPIILSVLTLGPTLTLAAQTDKEPKSGSEAATAKPDIVYFNGKIVTLGRLRINGQRRFG